MRLAVAALAATVGAFAAEAAPMRGPVRDAIEATVRERLKDPESARFKHSERVDGGPDYCGLVNSKNSYGGYAGFTPFAALIFSEQPPRVAVLGIEGADSNAVRTFCEMHGYTFE